MTTTRIRRLIAFAAATLTLAAPAAASAQPLTTVAIATYTSNGALVLDVEGGSTQVGAKVIQWYGNFSANQRWNFVTRPDGTQAIVNQKSGLCLTTNGIAGSQLYQWTCNGGARQQWTGDLEMLFGAVRTLSNPFSKLRVDVEGASRWAGARVIGWYPNTTDAQYFSYYQLS
jgi:hypothetical protein